MDQDKFNHLIDLAISIQNNARLSGSFIRPEDAMKRAKAEMGIPEQTGWDDYESPDGWWAFEIAQGSRTLT